MSWFSPKPTLPDPQIEEMVGKIEDLTREIAALRGERDGLKGARALEAERQALTEQIERLKVEKDRANEDNLRKVREAEHTAGLHRRQAEWESKRSAEEAILKVQQENLSKDQKRFEEQMEFHKAQISAEVSRLDGMVTSLMERLPIVNVNKKVTAEE